MGRVAGGDRRAFAALLERWGQRVLRFLHRRTGDLALARDAAERTWLQVWHGRDHFDPKHRFALWLFAIAARTGADAATPRVGDFGWIPSDDAAATRDRDALLAALHQLDPTNRRVVLLHIEGFGTEEIALALQLTADEVRRRRGVARRWLLPDDPRPTDPLVLVRAVSRLRTEGAEA
jgi:RNA polymerase sigma-70 factor (ECF subfamily)